MRNDAYLIRNTTRSEREKIVAGSLGILDGQCDGCMARIVDMYDDYIDGKKELSEINAQFHRSFVRDDPRADLESGTGSCVRMEKY